MKSYKHYFSNRGYIMCFLGGWVLLATGLFMQFLVTGYVNTLPSAPVTDLILSNIRVYDVESVFIYGSFLLLFVGIFVALRRPNYIPFMTKSVALFTLIRSLFVILTHITSFPTRIAIESPIFNHQFFTGIFTGNDLFFSGHTGLPFLLALMFWAENKTTRTTFLGFSILFAIVVLLGHIHYSIDVLSAFFITYGIFQICKILFKKEWEFFQEK